MKSVLPCFLFDAAQSICKSCKRKRRRHQNCSLLDSHSHWEVGGGSVYSLTEASLRGSIPCSFKYQLLPTYIFFLHIFLNIVPLSYASLNPFVSRSSFVLLGRFKLLTLKNFAALSRTTSLKRLKPHPFRAEPHLFR